MNCCEQSGPSAGCKQGPGCPVRASKAAGSGEAYPLPIWYAGDEPKPNSFTQWAYWGVVVLLALMSVLVLAGVAGYTWSRWAA